MKKFIIAAVAAISALFTSVVMAQTGVTYDVTDAKGYLVKELGVLFEGIALKCSYGVSTLDKSVPTDKARVHQNCRGQTTNGLTVIIGWTPASNDRFYDVQMPLMRSMMDYPKPIAALLGATTCKRVANTMRGSVAACQGTVIAEKEQIASMQVFYMKMPETDKLVLLVVHDNMQNRPTDVAQMMREQMNRLGIDQGSLAMASTTQTASVLDR